MRFSGWWTLVGWVILGCAPKDSGLVEVGGGVLLHRSVYPVRVDCEMDCTEAVRFWEPLVDEHPLGHRVRYCPLETTFAGLAELRFLDSGEILMSSRVCVEESLRGDIGEQTVIAHEIGHLLGLDDDAPGWDSIMAPGRLTPLKDRRITGRDRRSVWP